MPDQIKPIDQCKTLQELFADPARWTQRAYARKADGGPVGLCNPDATCFCLIGGLRRLGMAENELKNELGDVFRWNDAPGRTIQEVQDLVKKLNI